MGCECRPVSPPPNNFLTSRSYQLLATASKDKHVRIFKIYRNDSEQHGHKFRVTLAADLAEHESEVWRVAWNVTGTILCSSGEDGRMFLWKGFCLLRPHSHQGLKHQQLIAICKPTSWAHGTGYRVWSWIKRMTGIILFSQTRLFDRPTSKRCVDGNPQSKNPKK